MKSRAKVLLFLSCIISVLYDKTQNILKHTQIGYPEGFWSYEVKEMINVSVSVMIGPEGLWIAFTVMP